MESSPTRGTDGMDATDGASNELRLCGHVWSFWCAAVRCSTQRNHRVRFIASLVLMGLPFIMHQQGRVEIPGYPQSKQEETPGSLYGRPADAAASTCAVRTVCGAQLCHEMMMMMMVGSP